MNMIIELPIESCENEATLEIIINTERGQCVFGRKIYPIFTSYTPSSPAIDTSECVGGGVVALRDLPKSCLKPVKMRARLFKAEMITPSDTNRSLTPAQIEYNFLLKQVKHLSKLSATETIELLAYLYSTTGWHLYSEKRITFLLNCERARIRTHSRLTRRLMKEYSIECHDTTSESESESESE